MITREDLNIEHQQSITWGTLVMCSVLIGAQDSITDREFAEKCPNQKLRDELIDQKKSALADKVMEHIYGDIRRELLALSEFADRFEDYADRQQFLGIVDELIEEVK